MVEDDDAIGEPLAAGLGREGFDVTLVQTAAAALSAPPADLVLLDLGLPDAHGFEVCRQLRARSSVPIIIVTARDDETDRVVGLELGADDYVVKPFEPRELLLRIGSVLRRTRAAAPKSESAVAHFGPFTFSLERGELRNGAEIVRLTEREREILRLLCASAGASVSREALSGAGGSAQERTVDVQINRLRRKIEVDPANPVYLQTARGSGYRLLADG